MKRTVPLLLAIVAAIGAGYWWFVLRPAEAPAAWQGWVEADSLFIGPEVTGRLTHLSVARGDRIEKGGALFTVESDVAAAQVRVAEAAVAQAAAQLDAANASRQRPEEIDVLLAQEKAAKAALEESRLEYERAKTLAAKGTAAVSVLDQARAAYDRDTAELEQVRHQIAVARLPAREPDLKRAEEALAEARANLEQMRLQAGKHAVTAPATGTIQEVYYRAGEVVSAGNPVVALLPPSALKVRFFVPEAVLPRLHVGDTIKVTCDGCTAGKATIDFIAEEAEYTPPVIYSLEERAKLVFRIEAVPEKPEALRVGQPVSVVPEAGS
ncbi:HlyD family efflux transporter periplasmic adaptor subunit [Breoghania sp. JC706]|uniref:HlyD family secretion protein n=1 Tax=Breoghania sp. JC706 TaxID=3117732 RepID=UPI003009B6B3